MTKILVRGFGVTKILVIFDQNFSPAKTVTYIFQFDTIKASLKILNMKKAIFIVAIVAQAFNANAQPLVEVARKMKAIEGMQPQINDMERRLGIMQSVEPVLENAIKTLQKVVDVRGMGRRLLWDDISDLSPEQEYVLGSMQEHVNEIHQNLKILQSIPDVPIFESSRRLETDEKDLAAALAAEKKRVTACIAGKDDPPPLVEVARKMKAIEGMQPQINDIERRLGIMQSVEPVLENAIKTLQKVVDVRGMGHRRLSENEPAMTIVKKWSLESSKHWPKEFSWDGEKFPEHRTPLQRVSDMHVMVDYITEKLKNPKINGSPPMLRSKPNPLKSLDAGQPLVEVARKMKAIEGMQPQINDLERRLAIMQSVEPVLENAIKTLQKVVDVRGMGKK